MLPPSAVPMAGPSPLSMTLTTRNTNSDSSFSAENSEFFTEKLIVFNRETNSFSPRNQQFFG